MAAIGLATIAESIYRLNGRVGGRPVASGVALSAVSVVALTVLAVRKRRIAPRVPSRALHADGWLSGMGALLACVALLGTTFDEAFSWWWVDSAAAIAVACGALALSVVLVRDAGGEARSFD
jgi:divalent metal cation (Fe/Co/Zn/Cd) transporter